MSVDVEELKRVAKAIRARFVASLIRLLLGFTAGLASTVITVLLGPGIGCAASTIAGPALYAASIPLLRVVLEPYGNGRRVYTVGLIPFLAAWGVGFIFFSQLIPFT